MRYRAFHTDSTKCQAGFVISCNSWLNLTLLLFKLHVTFEELLLCNESCLRVLQYFNVFHNFIDLLFTVEDVLLDFFLHILKCLLILLDQVDLEEVIFLQISQML
jgi:hypothetical protein